MKPILGHDADDKPLREGDTVTMDASRAASDAPSLGIVAGLAPHNNPDDAVQSLRMTDGSVVYDVHCRRTDATSSH
ncbi:hypothetical protein [Salinicola sp. MIT1003]|jgi:hypothetical protein|uniref:hypothetical protein n=1 Tax=Salinicola sp. MIT1003 TaxID=1882734 RepID=UPI0008DE695A|nr:hypothetical protein [Salinicola sp. MIT1003]MEC8917709.1 hypothetical protein [Pseudomonadota bacterium]MED5500285.1 hypothetical protein [Pseudomonadota bacterium]OHZ04538.1 hypothetical protein BC443_01420 [Salinicola sp. MIT1003]